MKIDQQVVVVGGGVVGLSIAWELAGRGVSVRLLNRDAPSRRTSWTAAGILPPANLDHATDPIERLRGLSHRLYPQWIQEIEAVSEIDCGLRRCGGWYLANSAGERAAMLGMEHYWHDLGIECEAVSPETFAEREPAIASWTRRSAQQCVWWTPDEWQIRPPHLLRSLEVACRARGVVIEHDADVESIDFDDDIARVQVGGQRWDAERIVLAAGAWSGELASGLGLQGSVIPVRGQMLLLKTQPGRLRSIINVGHRYLVPREDGYLLVGSCEEEVGFQRGTTEAAIESLHAFAIQLVPELQSAAIVKCWSGLRPMTFDGFPMIGRLPGRTNVYIAAGHFRSGIHLAPATAKCLVDQMMGEEPDISLQPFTAGKQLTQLDS